MKQPVLVSHHLCVGYCPKRAERREILSNIHVTLYAGEFVCLLGPNGVGKSTLLRTLARMQKPLGGSVTLDGVDLHRLNQRALARRLSVVLTERVESGIMPTYDLIGMGRYPHTGWNGQLTAHDHTVIRRAIALTRSETLAMRNVMELSDGERQRVMIARALAQEPAVMFLDEPTAFLDAPRRAELTGLLRQLAHDTGLAVLLSTHDIELALRTADRVWLITPDKQLLTGAPEDLVLEGKFAASFSSPDYIFDATAGGFHVCHPYRRRARVACTGLHGLWAQRALERKAFAVTTDPLDDSVEFEITGAETTQGWRWYRIDATGTHEYQTLADLTAALCDTPPTPHLATLSLSRDYP